jgi:RHS repeat-associated protein
VVEASGRMVDYAYDDLYRLVEEAINDPVNGSETITYTYDDFGNRLSKTDTAGTTTYGYDANDRLLSESGPAFDVVYDNDDNGNMVSKTVGVDATIYLYDQENRLIGVTAPTETIGYAYDADGIRIAKNVDGVRTDFLVDKNRPYAQVLEEYDDAGGMVVSYVYGDDLISQNRSGVASFYHYDGQLSTRLLTDASESVTDSYAYDSFGSLTSRTGATENSYLYTGEQYDPNVGFYYLRARYYSSETGRFITTDPWQGSDFEPASMHKYLYANANPTMFVDPSGKMSISESSVAQAIQSSVMKIGTRIEYMMRVYDKVLTVRDLAVGLHQIFQMIQSGNFASAWAPSVLPGISFQDAIISLQCNLPKAIGTGIGNWSIGYIKSRRKGQKLKAYYLYLPNFIQSAAFKLKTNVKINGVPLKIVVGGAKKGRLAGIGVHMGVERQLFRMDYHRPSPYHGLTGLGTSGNELSYWIDDYFHYHVMKW